MCAWFRLALGAQYSQFLRISLEETYGNNGKCGGIGLVKRCFIIAEILSPVHIVIGRRSHPAPSFSRHPVQIGHLGFSRNQNKRDSSGSTSSTTLFKW